LANATRIDLRFNQIRAAPRLEDAAGLKELYLGNNYLTTLGNCEFLPKALQVLDVRDNKIATIGPGISWLTQLERLDVTNNDLRDLPAELGTVRSIKSIVLDGNPIKTIRRDIISRGTVAIMQHLQNKLGTPLEEERESKAYHAKQEASATTNQAQFGHLMEYVGKGTDAVPDTLWDAVAGAEISKAVISKNALTVFPRQLLGFAATLTILDLSFNRISTLGPEVAALTGLATLNVRNNKLSALPQELASLKGLTDVIISLNRFADFPPVLYGMPSLSTIVATDNQIFGVDAQALQRLQGLSCLDLTNNSINKVPPELALLPNLKSLKLEGNCFKIPRPAILAKGTPALLEYLRDRIA